LVGNNHHVAPFEGEDFQMFEKDLPGGNTTGFSADSKIGALPLETCETMNHSWGFNLMDANYKTTKSLVQYLVRSAGHNANFLLNIGPMSNGKIQPEFQKTLREMGDWLKIYGETIYGTRGVASAVRDWGVMTEKGNKTYLHILKAQDLIIAVPTGNKKVKSAQLFKDKSNVKILTTTKDMTILQLPKLDENELDTVVELSF
jgi:alpha-L-fucosidase